MTNDDMVEVLAKRLLETYEREPIRDPLREILVWVSEDAHESFSLMARECLRQMEWARRNCWQPHVTEYIGPTTEFPNTRRVRVDGLEPLTIAPDDWQP